MKLLLDENISRRLVADLQATFPGTRHVVEEGLEAASDDAVWTYARQHGFVIVNNKDDDFSAFSNLRGHPPRLIRVTLGNCSNTRRLNALLIQQPAITAACADPAVALVELIPDTPL